MDNTHRPRSRRKFLLVIFSVLILGGLTAHLLSEIAAENAWDDYKTAAAARGEPMDWQHYVPLRPPDAQNFFAAPIAQKWIPAKQMTTSTGKEIVHVSASQLQRPAFSINISPETKAENPHHPPGIPYTIPLTLEQLRRLPESDSDDALNLHSLHAWFEQWEPGFEELREAAKRPFAYLPGDYSSAPLIPIQNFVAVRTLAQTCSTKANINLLLHHPEAARKDFQSLEAVIHSLDTQPKTLVAAMIQVAVAGLYCDTLHDGIEAGLWPPDQLADMQAYLEKLDLLTPVYRSLMEGERVGACQLLDEATSISGSVKLSRAINGENSRIREFVAALFPRGWIRRNELYIVGAMDQTASVVDIKAHRFHPKRAKQVSDRLARDVSEFSVDRMIAGMVVPNVGRALETTAKNQTMLRSAAIVCALQRYKSARGAYPEKIADLAPEYIQTIPRDIVDAQPVRYIKNADDSYLLYSIGPNERDDHGDLKKDWVWTFTPSPPPKTAAPVNN
jgi:hypothetical protein